MRKSTFFGLAMAVSVFLSGCGNSTITISGAGSSLQASDPSTFMVKVYGIWMSKSELCTDAVQFLDVPNATYQDFNGGVTLGSIDNSSGAFNGTWKCVIIKMSDLLKFVPSVDDGNCIADTEYSIDVCNGIGSSTISIEDNSTINCVDAAEDTVYLYVSTASASAVGGGGIDPWKPPTTSSNDNNGFTLGSVWEVLGSKAGSFIVDPSGKVDGSGGGCDLQPPSMSFQ